VFWALACAGSAVVEHCRLPYAAWHGTVLAHTFKLWVAPQQEAVGCKWQMETSLMGYAVASVPVCPCMLCHRLLLLLLPVNEHRMSRPVYKALPQTVDCDTVV
jgi:hypothetical protein